MPEREEKSGFGGTYEGRIVPVTIGATRDEGGTRSRSYSIGGEGDLPFLGNGDLRGSRPLVALEICDDPALWPQVVNSFLGDLASDPAGLAHEAETRYRADLVRLYLTSTRRRGFSDYPSIGTTIKSVLQATGLPMILEGSADPAIDSEVYQQCGEAAAGEKVLLGTAEAGRYRSVAAAAMAYHHGVIAQSPIDVNLAKQLNILLHEIGVPPEAIVIDPYTGALGYGFEYSYSVMERIRFSALKGDQDLAMPMISSATDSLNVKEVREAESPVGDEMAVRWEYYTTLPAITAGASIVCVRHPLTVKPLKAAIAALWGEPGGDR